MPISKQNSSGKMAKPSVFTGPKHIILASPTSYVIPMNCVHTVWQKQLIALVLNLFVIVKMSMILLKS